MDYPKQKTAKCRFCGQPVRWIREEPGRLFNGEMIYSYTEPSPHPCPEREAIRKGLARPSRAMARALAAPPAGEDGALRQQEDPAG